MSSSWRRCGLALMLTASACGTDPLAGTNFRGKPLASITGTLAGVTTAPTGPVRLAIAWYPMPDIAGAPVGAPTIVTSSVAYQATFPISFSFDLYEPPPDAAFQRPSADGPRGAAGVLIAYVDENGNETLDTIPPGGSSVDTVLGASVQDVAVWARGRIWEGAHVGATALTYWEGAEPSGYSLFRAGQYLPIATPVALELTEGADGNLFICEQLWMAFPEYTAPGTSCAALPAKPVLTVRGSFSIDSSSNLRQAYFTVSDGVHDHVPEATVLVNGLPLLFIPPDGSWLTLDGFLGRDALAPVVGLNTFAVTLPGTTGISGTITMAGPFAITAPHNGSIVARGSPVSVSWSPAAHATEYHLSLHPQPGNGLAVWSSSTTETSTLISPIQIVGDVELRVRASGVGMSISERNSRQDIYIAGDSSWSVIALHVTP